MATTKSTAEYTRGSESPLLFVSRTRRCAMLPFYTIGHSNRSLDDFVALLSEANVQHVVDVRAFPRSRTNPQFNEANLPEALRPFQWTYEHVPALGGRRGRSRPVPFEVNAFWSN